MAYIEQDMEPAYFQVEILIAFGEGTDRTEEQARAKVESLGNFARRNHLPEPFVEAYERKPRFS